MEGYSMGIFGKKKTVGRTYRRKTEDDIEKADERKQKRWANDVALKKAKDDPVFAAKWASKLTGIDISSDPTEEEQRKLRKKLTEMALARIDSDPALKERATQLEIDKILGDGGGGTDFFGEEGSFGGGDILEQLDYMEKVKAKLGGGGSGWSSLINKDTAIELLKLIQAFASSGAGKAAGQLGVTKVAQLASAEKEKIYVIEIDGKPREVSEEEFSKRFAPKQAKETEEVNVNLEPAINQDTQDLIDETMEAIDTREPEIYVDELFERSKDSNEVLLSSILGFASKLDYVDIVEKIIPYRDVMEYTTYVNKVMDNEEWCGRALKAIKEKVNA